MFEGFEPKLSERSRSSDVLFLANIQPDLQREVRAQLPHARFVALDSMNLWIDIARDSLVRAIESVDCVILNDAELRQLTGKPNLVSGGARGPLLGARPRSPERRVRGPSVVVAKQGEYGAALVTRESFFALPAYPLETRDRPHRRGRHVRGRARRLHRRPSRTRSSPTSCCAARWPTRPCSRRSTSRSSGPSASSA